MAEDSTTQLNQDTTLNEYFSDESIFTNEQKACVRELFIRAILAAKGKQLNRNFYAKLTESCGENKPNFGNTKTFSEIVNGSHKKQAEVETAWKEAASDNNWLEAQLTEFIAQSLSTAVLRERAGDDKKYNKAIGNLLRKIFDNFPKEIFDNCKQLMDANIEVAKEKINQIPNDQYRNNRQTEIRMRLKAMADALPTERETLQAPEQGRPETTLRRPGLYGGRIGPYSGPTAGGKRRGR